MFLGTDFRQEGIIEDITGGKSEVGQNEKGCPEIGPFSDEIEQAGSCDPQGTRKT